MRSPSGIQRLLDGCRVPRHARRCARAQRDARFPVDLVAECLQILSENELPQLVAAKNVPEIRAWNFGSRAHGACRNHDRLRLERAHELDIGRRRQSHVDAGIAHLAREPFHDFLVRLVGDRCKPCRTAQAITAFEQHDAMTLEREPSRSFHPRRTAAHDDHLLWLRRRDQLELTLVRSIGIHRATDGPAQVDLAHAGVAVDTGPHRVRTAFRQLARQVGIRQQLAAHREKVEVTRGDVLVSRLRLDAAGRDDRNA